MPIATPLLLESVGLCIAMGLVMEYILQLACFVICTVPIARRGGIKMLPNHVIGRNFNPRVDHATLYSW